MGVAVEKQAETQFDFDPRTGEGLLIPEGYTKNIIKKPRITDEIKDELGTMTEREIKMLDGRRYDVKSYNPHERVTDYTVLMTTPWLTEPSGFNVHMALTLTKLGYPVDLVSAERNVELKPNIGVSAHNQLEIMKLTATEHQRDPNKIISTGVSRAAMIGIVLTALASMRGEKVGYGDYIVPCYPTKLSIKQLGSHALLPASEIITMRHILDFPWQTLKHYPDTFSVLPKRMLNHLATAPHLMSGYVARAIDQIPHDFDGHVTAYKGDVMSQGENWVKLFADHPNMDVELIKGGAHLSCASPGAMKAWKTRMALQSKILQKSQ